MIGGTAHQRSHQSHSEEDRTELEAGNPLPKTLAGGPPRARFVSRERASSASSPQLGRQVSQDNSGSMASSVECEHCLGHGMVPTAAEYAPGKLDSSKRNCLVLQGRACEAQKTFVEKQRYHMGKDTY